MLINGECLEEMKKLPDKSIDMILCDLPYGTTACKWDCVIPFNKLWKQYNRIIKDTGVIALFGNNKFSIKLANSCFDLFKYKWVWLKRNSTLFVHAKNRPMVQHEDILIFSKAPMGHKSLLGERRMTYNPQGLIEVDETWKRPSSNFKNTFGKRPSHKLEIKITHKNYPKDILNFPELLGKKVHPNEKPIDLLEYIIKTYSNEDELILDNTMGSGSTGVACVNTKRNFIGMELNKEYFNIATKRINDATE